VLGAAFYWFVLRSNAPPPAALPAAPASFGSGTLPGTWRVEPGPNVFAGYRIHELFGGDALSRIAVGRTPGVSGEMLITGSRVSTVDVTADMTKLTSDQGRRDRYITSHAIDSTSFPTATFHLTQPIGLSGLAVVGRVAQLSATGQLTLHGVTRSVVVPLQARWDGSSISVSGGAPIVLADYHIDPPNIGGLVSVDATGTFEFQLTFAKA
ncbi:MAG TPA: YceI family protein, partial [Acidimicrobiales bacterium]|nr:YceI family protein [Acidimicrobiales bacterium]